MTWLRTGTATAAAESFPIPARRQAGHRLQAEAATGASRPPGHEARQGASAACPATPRAGGGVDSEAPHRPLRPACRGERTPEARVAPALGAADPRHHRDPEWGFRPFLCDENEATAHATL